MASARCRRLTPIPLPPSPRWGEGGFRKRCRVAAALLPPHHTYQIHPLSPAVDAATRARLDVGPVPRGGNSHTVGNTGGGDNQTSGASFRIFVDTRDWDLTLGMNTPGQVGDPDSPLYDNLFHLWANDQVFPAFYSREKVEGVAWERLELRPASRR